jgi:hypothetical protein
MLRNVGGGRLICNAGIAGRSFCAAFLSRLGVEGSEKKILLVWRQVRVELLARFDLLTGH